MAEFVRVAGRGDVPAGEMLIVEIEGEEIVLANVDGQIYAFGNGCTHRGGPLGEGLLEGDEVECPFHQGRFNVKTGEAVQEPPTEPIPTYQVQLDGDDIKVAKG
ncbi:MAG: non-heme iron oxygenase ferredoxin subunit [Dehalococcoidia bacterium]|jgi:nitrite reductase/ring-hydroxylating ferredoxin subunit|nr:non-heme iron oxygenase ferredoxin subunit [Dehalococcoidia bacterium]